MHESAADDWESLLQSVDSLRIRIGKIKTRDVNSSATRSLCKDIVQRYFRLVRHELISDGIDLSDLDGSMQDLMQLTSGRNRRTSYLLVLRRIEKGSRTLSAERELRIGEAAFAKKNPPSDLQPNNAAVLDTLRKLVPVAALSYEQALLDLHDGVRVSYRGTATELRETLREVLDHLAPNETVMSSPGFRLEQGQMRPTMKQKARFILKARGLQENERRAIEDSVSTITRSIYERASASVHTPATKREVSQLKEYIDAVLGDILEVR